MQYKRLSRCGIDGCKQTLFHVDDGQWFCKNGHLREGELEVEADDEGLAGHGAKATRIAKEKEKTTKILRGRRGFELYLQCYQLVLRKQVAWLVNEKGFPEDLEVIVRDLWTLRLQKLSSTIPSAEDLDSQEKDPDGSIDTFSAGYSSQSSYLYTSGEESQVSSTASRLKRKRQRRKVPKSSDRPKLIVTIALCYLGLLLLRVGVCLGDMQRWMEEAGLVYLRAIREVPAEMKERLSAEYFIALDPRAIPPMGLLYHTVQELVQMLQLGFGVMFPSLNEVLLLKRFIQDLGLPPEIYTATQRLASYLSITFTWNGLRPVKRVFDLPEAKLMSLVVIATKLLFSIDGIERTPWSNAEPAAIDLNWGAWDEFLRAGNDARRGLLGRGHVVEGELEVDVKEVDVFTMKDPELDRYMDWYEKTWVEPGESKLTEQILNLFPISREKPEDREDAERESEDCGVESRLKSLHQNTEIRDAVPSEEENGNVVRPGDQYLLYSASHELPVQLQTLLQAAADLLAIPRDDLGMVVKHLEIKFREMVREDRKKERRQRKLDTTDTAT
ncbi:hypothetical protein RUND412_008808 [Rhizina undulata]